MSADLHIHVLDNGISTNDVREFQSNTLGSKHFRGLFPPSNYTELSRKVSESPSIWIGEVSWLKAAVLDDEETFIPPTVMQVHEIVGEDFPVLDDALIEKVCKAFDVKNPTSYSLARVDGVRSFLEMHKGKQVFTISW